MLDRKHLEGSRVCVVRFQSRDNEMGCNHFQSLIFKRIQTFVIALQFADNIDILYTIILF